MATIRNRVFPFHDIPEHDKVSLYRSLQTGLAGTLVKIVTGSANTQSTETDGFGSTAMGQTYNSLGIVSNRYETDWAVTPTVSGDTRYTALGFTELSTLEFDENGFPLKFDEQRAKAIGAVVSGNTVPIVKKAAIYGVWGNYIDTSMGAPQPGHVVVISRSGEGLIGAVDPTIAANFRAVSDTGIRVYDDRSVIGKWLSSLPTSTNTGIASEFSAQGGYAFFTFDCTR